jgi:CRP-like cAMP-binding protein
VISNPGSTHGGNHLLAALHPADLSLLEPYFYHIALEQGALLHEQGEEVEQIYFPHSGMISLVTVMQNGQAIDTAAIGRSGAVCFMTGLGLPRAFARAVVRVPGAASRIANSHFQKAISQSDLLRELIIGYNEVLLVQLQQTAACNALHEVEARLCRWVLQIRDRIDSDTIPLTQEFLAQMLGVRRTSVTEIAQKLQDAGLIRYRRGQIEILDRKRLEEMACECYGIIRDQIDKLLPQAKD